MKLKKKVKIIIAVLAAVVVAATVAGIIWIRQPEKNSQPEKKECTPFTGGAYTLLFDTNGGNEIKSMRICIACSPDSYEEIPTPTKEGDTFEGWYYDKSFKNKVSETSTGKINPVANKNKNGCLVGYKDITLYAKWSTAKVEDKKEEKKPDKQRNKKQSNSKTAYCEDGSKPSNGMCTSTVVIDATSSYTCGGLEEYGDKCIEDSLPAISGVCPGNSTYSLVLDACYENTNDDEETCTAKGGYINYGSDICTIQYSRPTTFVCDGDREGMEIVGNICYRFVPKTLVYSCPSDYNLEESHCKKTITTPAKNR